MEKLGLIMNTEKIAIVVDSGTDVPQSIIEKYNMYVIPLLIHYNDGEYRDKVDISADAVYDRLEEEIPKTSLPSMEVVVSTLQMAINDGYKKIIIVSISSALSGTYNALRLAAEEISDAEIFVVDTKNIGIGAGFTAITAAKLIGKGYSFSVIIDKLTDAIENTVIYFCVDTLKYLQKGGRIGTVAAAVGTAFYLKPIISCDKEGKYYTASKTLGRKQSLQKAMQMAGNFAKEFENVNFAIANGRAEKEAKELIEKAKEFITNTGLIVTGQISPALVIHTGPGLIGICVQKKVY